MPRVVIYLFPVLMDMVLSAVFFLVTVQAAAAHSTAMQVGGLLAVWSCLYMITSLIMAVIATRRSAALLMVLACAGVIACSFCFLTRPGMTAMYVLMAAQGVASAAFFGPFQVFMKYVDAGGGRTVATSSGLYVWSWSTGFALGPFVSGFLWQKFGWNVCHLLNAGVCGAIAAGILALRHYAHSEAVATTSPEKSNQASDEDLYASMPDLAWMAWLFGGAGCVVVSLVRGAFPMSGQALEISKANQGIVLAVLSGVQAIVGLALGRFRFWAYRPAPLLLFGLTGTAGLLLFAQAQSTIMFALGATALGIYNGSFYFYFVFHSLVHPHRGPRYVAINEAVVGLMSMVGPLASGWIIPRAGLRGAYLASGGAILVMAILQAVLHLRWRSGATPSPAALGAVAGSSASAVI